MGRFDHVSISLTSSFGIYNPNISGGRTHVPAVFRVHDGKGRVIFCGGRITPTAIRLRDLLLAGCQIENIWLIRFLAYTGILIEPIQAHQAIFHTVRPFRIESAVTYVSHHT